MLRLVKQLSILNQQNMLRALYFCALWAALAACRKQADPDPTPITAAYRQLFEVRMQQVATLPQTLPAEITVRIEDIDDARPPSTVISQSGGKVTITVRVTPAGTTGETLTLSQGLYTTVPDSAAVTAATGRYDVRFINILPLDKYETVAKRDKVIQLRVTRR